MPSINRSSLLSLEEYSKERSQFRKRVIAHKEPRKIFLGHDISLSFEDELTIRYQIQEMLRIEKIFEDEEINNELEAYNPLIPNGDNLKATMMIEIVDEIERKARLKNLIDIEKKIYIKVADHEKIFAIADEDLDRQNSQKTSSVHFLRFEISNDMKRSLKKGEGISIGVEHENYSSIVNKVPELTRQSLINDLNL